jgi:hypothetical protein
MHFFICVGGVRAQIYLVELRILKCYDFLRVTHEILCAYGDKNSGPIHRAFTSENILPTVICVSDRYKEDSVTKRSKKKKGKDIPVTGRGGP